MTTASDLFSGHGYSGNDGFSGTKPLDDAILFTNSGITALVELFLENFDAYLSKVEILKLTKIPKTPFFQTRQKSLHKQLPSEVINVLACFHCFYCWKR